MAAPGSTGAGAASGVMGRMRAGLEQTQAAQGIGARMQWGSAGGGRTSSADAIGRLERLQKLKESGAITDTELGEGEDPRRAVAGGTGGVVAVGPSVSVSGRDWTAAGLCGCTSDGALRVTIGSESFDVPVDCAL